MHKLFFDDDFKATKQRKHVRKAFKKQNSKNKKLMGKKFETDYNVHGHDEDEQHQQNDHVVKRSNTAIL